MLREAEGRGGILSGLVRLDRRGRPGNCHRAASARNFLVGFGRRELRQLAFFSAVARRHFFQGSHIRGLPNQGLERSQLEQRRNLLFVRGIRRRARQQYLPCIAGGQRLQRAAPGGIGGRRKFPQLFALGQSSGQRIKFGPGLRRFDFKLGENIRAVHQHQLRRAERQGQDFVPPFHFMQSNLLVDVPQREGVIFQRPLRDGGEQTRLGQLANLPG